MFDTDVCYVSYFTLNEGPLLDPPRKIHVIKHHLEIKKNSLHTAAITFRLSMINVTMCAKTIFSNLYLKQRKIICLFFLANKTLLSYLILSFYGH